MIQDIYTQVPDISSEDTSTKVQKKNYNIGSMAMIFDTSINAVFVKGGDFRRSHP